MKKHMGWEDAKDDYVVLDGETSVGCIYKSAGMAKQPVAGADRDLEFVSGHKLDPISAAQIPTNMIGRLLDDGDLRKLQRMLLKKKPPAPSERRRTATKRRVGNR
jgi:hypothetical protein